MKLGRAGRARSVRTANPENVNSPSDKKSTSTVNNHHLRRSVVAVVLAILSFLSFRPKNNTNMSFSFDNNNGDTPGKGWSNGDIPQSMYPVTRDGRIQLYAANRRWISLHTGWTRIGSGHQHDFRHSTSGVGDAHEHDTPEEEAETVRSLIAQLCEKFYQHGKRVCVRVCVCA